MGYGNPSRGDDALGPELLQRLNGRGPADVEFLTDFQLQVEHALDLVGRELVLFIDASVSCRSPFAFERLTAKPDASYTTHAMSPAAVLHVYRVLYQETPPPSFLLTIRGERFELGDDLTPAAKEGLTAAVEFAEVLVARPDPAFWLGLADFRNHA
jgi:hydrogenase maturation protease